jgi:hypothetical protein
MLALLVVTFLLCAQLSFGWLPSTPPEYCSKDIGAKSIPPLSTDELAQVKELKQVQVMIRHGARTPYGLFTCWKNYDVSWNNCNVTELMIESPSMTASTKPGQWLYRKLYDGSLNYLGGNCYTGQLLSEGYQQELTNGGVLYDAYIDGAFQLFPTNDWEQLNSTTDIYLRSDDEQRTLMSGQILLRTFLNVIAKCAPPMHNGVKSGLLLVLFILSFFAGIRGDDYPLAHGRLQPGPDLPQLAGLPATQHPPKGRVRNTGVGSGEHVHTRHTADV